MAPQFTAFHGQHPDALSPSPEGIAYPADEVALQVTERVRLRSVRDPLSLLGYLFALQEAGAAVPVEAKMAEELFQLSPQGGIRRHPVPSDPREVRALATAVTERLMGRLPRRSSPANIWIAPPLCVAPPMRSIRWGGRMVADTLEMNGWHAHLPRLEMAIGKVREAKRDLPIVLGGQAFRHGGGDIPSKYPDVALMDSLAELESFIQSR